MVRKSFTPQIRATSITDTSGAFRLPEDKRRLPSHAGLALSGRRLNPAMEKRLHFSARTRENPIASLLFSPQKAHVIWLRRLFRRSFQKAYSWSPSRLF